MLDKNGRVVRKPLCVYASPLLPGQKANGRLRTCTLACFGGTVTRMGHCAICEYHVAPRPATAEVAEVAEVAPKKPCGCGCPDCPPKPGV